MDNNLNENWLDDILGQSQNTEEIKPDEQAIAAAGLTHPDDLELERIVQETMAEDWETIPTPEATDDPGPDATQFFTPAPAADTPVQEPEQDILTMDDSSDSDAFWDALLAADSLDSKPKDPEPETPQQPQETPSEADKLLDELLTSGILSDEAPATEVAQPEPEPAKTEEKPAPKESNDAPVRKLRPAKQKGYGLFGIPHILATGIWAVLILFIGITLGKTVWLCAEDLLALGKTGQAASITIEQGDTIADVAHKLQTAGMIRYTSLFETFAKITGKSEGIQPGIVDFDGKIVYDYNALINAMSIKVGPTDTIEVTIPEGYNCKQIFALLEQKGVCTVNELEKYAADGELSDYWFLEGVKRGSRYCLEGFLFPDTYEFYLESDPKSAIEKLLDGFEYRFSDQLKEKFETLKETTRLDISFYEMVIMASMVQKEKAADLEGYKIASVFYNRLRRSAEYPMLNCDSTIVYAKDVYAGSTSIIETYDTYKIRGLPPTPISNPGLSSLDAALEPEDTAFYYFVLDKDANEHVFAKTYSEHQRNLQRLGYYD